MPRSVLFKTSLMSGTGYGNDGIALARAMENNGFDVRLLPMAVMPPLPMDVAMMFVKGVDEDFDLLLHHADPNSLVLTEGEQSIKAKKVAWTMWEYTTLPEDMQGPVTENLKAYDELWVYDEVSQMSLQSAADEAGIPIRLLQGGFWSDEWEFNPRDRDWSGIFRFCMAGQLHARKNPFAAVEAFYEIREEFGDQVELHLKTSVRSLHPAMMEHNPGLFIHYDFWPRNKMIEFYGQCHTYLATSWGEGKNLPALEAQRSGMPVIYSNFGGHRMWGSSQWGWPVNGEVGLVSDGLSAMKVDHGELVKAMREAVSNRSETRRKGELAARMVSAQNDWERVVVRMKDILNT